MQDETKKTKEKPAWVDLIKPYTVADHRKSIWQLVNSVVPFFAVMTLAYLSLGISYLLALAFSFLGALFMMRIFIIQHDCGHNSFFNSSKLNNAIGPFLGVLTMTPYASWRSSHAKHHASSGDLDFRGFGDIETITVEEYKALSTWRKFRYRFYRHPLIMFVVGPTILFVIFNRFPLGLGKGQEREKNSVYFTNLMLALIFIGVGSITGYLNLLSIWLPMMIFGSSIGVYLFYVQHQFEDTYWRWHHEWDYAEAALRGSSFFKMPRLLQWFSGNIGFHHLHHLSPKIPNYNLEKAHYENPTFQKVHTITLLTSFRNIFLHLWDEQTHKLISWREYARLMRGQRTQAAA
jgi:omega-6 fatty acid desaturase (delta-12 desaturase)